MNTSLSVLGTLACGLAVLLTLGLAAGFQMFTMRKPSGPDAMGLAAPFFGYIFVWLLMLVAAFFAAGRGSFGWISGTPGLPTLAVIATMVGLAILCIFSAFVSMETRYAWRTAAGMAGALAMPLAVQGLILACLWLEPAGLSARAWPRWAGGVLGALALVTYGACAVMWLQAQKAHAERVAEMAEDSRKEELKREEQAKQKDIDDAAALAAMPDDAPLREFVKQLFIDKSEAHHARALERIGKLPNLTARIDELLSDPLPIQREYCSNYIRHAPKVDPAWAPAFAKSIDRLAQDYRTEAGGDHSRNLITHVKGLTWGTILTAQRFEGVRFDAEVKRLREAVSQWPQSGERDEATSMIDRYLNGEKVPD